MPTVFEDERTRLIQASCFAIDPKTLKKGNGLHHVITDPPYDERTHEGASGRYSNPTNGDKTAYGDLTFEAFTAEDIDKAAKLFCELSEGWILTFCAFEQLHVWKQALEDHGARWVRTQAWLKKGVTPQFSGDRPGQWGEAIATAWNGEGRMKWNGGGHPGIYAEAIKQSKVSKIHPTQKPVALLRRLVSLFSEPGETIVDPFSGSGSTLRAARDLSRLGVGCELSAEWAGTAAHRFTEAITEKPSETKAERQLRLFA